MKKIFALLLTLALLTACAPPAEPIPADSGLSGQALIGPTCPVFRADQPCADAPYQAHFVVTRPNGQEVTRFDCDEEGKFKVNLIPGDYTLHAENPDGNMLPRAEDVPFTVTAGAFTNIIVMFDSGIR